MLIRVGGWVFNTDYIVVAKITNDKLDLTMGVTGPNITLTYEETNALVYHLIETIPDLVQSYRDDRKFIKDKANATNNEG